MRELTRRIGLSLGADLCWPICYEEILRRLDLSIPIDGDRVRIESERVAIEPFDLRGRCPYDMVLDRVTHWYTTSREWIKKAVLMDDLYVLNNPWSIQSMEKQTTYCAMMRLGLSVPETWMIPPREYAQTDDLEVTLGRYARLFDPGEVGERVGFPCYVKPYDGGAWRGVSRAENPDDLRRIYETSGTNLMHVQRAVDPHDLFVRAIGVGPQVRLVPYDPGQPLHDRYRIDFDFLEGEEASVLSDMLLTINGFFGWDFNSCESLRQHGRFHPIDFANACPDSQVTSLHYHFPWLVKSMLRWSIFCAATKRPMRRTLDWDPYYAIADSGMSDRDKLAGYARITRERMDAERFDAFCNDHLGHLDDVALDFFGSDIALGAVHEKVASLFPRHEVDRFTSHFWGLLQFWRKTEADRMGVSFVPPGAAAGGAD